MENERLTPQEELDLQQILSLLDEPPASEAPNAEAEAAPAEPATESAASIPEPDIGNKRKSEVHKSIVMYLHDLVYLMAIIVLVFLLCFRIVIVSGDSMYDTLVDGDYLLLVSGVFYQEPQAGDVIVASKDDYNHGTPIIKRVIAVEGQVVDIDFITGTVYVDGVALEEDYIYSKTTMDEGTVFPLTVEEGCVFVLGDNRGRSKDSRDPEIGLIDYRQIVGKAICVIFPGNDSGEVERKFDRIGVIG